MLRRGADPSAKGFHNGTLLCEAVGTRNREAVKLLLEYGADPNGVGYYGSALMWAVMYDIPEMVPVLLAGGADPRLVEPSGRSPMDEAVALERWAILRLLRSDKTGVQDGATPGAKN